MKHTILILVIGFAMSGCSPYANKFDCPYGEGIGCASLSKVNKMLDAQMIEIEDDLPSKKDLKGQKRIPLYFGPSRPLQMINVGSLALI